MTYVKKQILRGTRSTRALWCITAVSSMRPSSKGLKVYSCEKARTTKHKARDSIIRSILTHKYRNLKMKFTKTCTAMSLLILSAETAKGFHSITPLQQSLKSYLRLCERSKHIELQSRLFSRPNGANLPVTLDTSAIPAADLPNISRQGIHQIQTEEQYE